MAISLKTVAAWTGLFGTVTPTLPGTPAAGDRYYLWAYWKPYTATASISSGWTQLPTTLFADGSVAQADSVGSMTVGCWWRDWQSGDPGPTLTMGGVPAINIGGYVMALWTKGGSETFGTPTAFTAAWPAQSTGTLNASAAGAVADNSVVMCMMAFRNDIATIVRTTTSLSASPAITWNGNYVESPATHHTTATNNDSSADLGYRLVTTGNASTTLSTEATLATSETGAVLWVMQPAIAAPGGGFFF